MIGCFCGVLQLPIHHDFCVGTSIAKLEGPFGWKRLQRASDLGMEKSLPHGGMSINQRWAKVLIYQL